MTTGYVAPLPVAPRTRLSPGPRLVAALFAASAAALLPALFAMPDGALYGVALILIAAVAGVDLARGPRPRDLAAESAPPAELLVGGDAVLTLRVRAEALRRAARVEVLLEVDDRCTTGPPASADLSPGGGAALDFPLYARRRGPPAPFRAWLRVESPWRFWRRTTVGELGLLPSVEPDVRPVREAARRAGLLVGAAPGLRPRLTPGEGSDFDALREFAPGHDRRALHWKASARHRKLLVRDFRAEGARHVVFAFDTGRLQLEPLAGLQRFDLAARAALRLAYDATRAGDLVGVYDFADVAGRFRPPTAGHAGYRALRAAVASLAPAPVETNFTVGLAALAVALKRRTLIVVFTDFADATTAELMTDHLGALAKRHLVLFVALRDAALETLADRAPATAYEVAASATAHEFVRERAQVLLRLRRFGVEVVDASPDASPAALVDRWLRLKQRERL